MSALVLGPPQRRRAEEIVSYAREHIYRPGPGVRPPGLDPRYVARFEVGVRCVFSFTQMPDGGLYRHLSISVAGSRSGFPNPTAAELLGELFGFEGPMDSWFSAPVEHERCVVLVQELSPDGAVRAGGLHPSTATEVLYDA